MQLKRSLICQSKLVSVVKPTAGSHSVVSDKEKHKTGNITNDPSRTLKFQMNFYGKAKLNSRISINTFYPKMYIPTV